MNPSSITRDRHEFNFKGDHNRGVLFLCRETADFFSKNKFSVFYNNVIIWNVKLLYKISFRYSFHDKFLLNSRTLQCLTCSLLKRHACNLSLWGLGSGGSSDEKQKSGWDIFNSPTVCENLSEDLFNTSGLQLVGLMRNQSCVHTYVQIFVETSSVTYAWSLDV